MSTDKQTSRLTKIGVIAVFTALACLGTLVIKVPIPATTGYFNIGDIFVILAGLYLGPIGGLVTGAIGPGLADAIGFPVFIPATCITKGLEGLVVGLLAGDPMSKPGRKMFAAISGGIVMIAGYFVFEAFIYPAVGEHIPAFAITDIAAAVVELVPNTVQAVIGVAGGVSLWKGISGIQATKAK